jgi:hypothetical protein
MVQSLCSSTSDPDAAGSIPIYTILIMKMNDVLPMTMYCSTADTAQAEIDQNINFCPKDLFLTLINNLVKHSFNLFVQICLFF